jgi:hypothetical protein
MRITREQAQDMAEAHAQGLHAELPREGCPECEDRPLRDYPPAVDWERMAHDPALNTLDTGAVEAEQRRLKGNA